MHPNWKALATLHIPLKRFVTEGAPEQQPRSRKNKHEINNVTATEVKEFYDAIISTPESAPRIPIPTPPREEVPNYPPRIPFDRNKFFRAAMANDAETICLFDYHQNDINTTDTFGWTALMMAACEGAPDAVEALLILGANTSCKDKSGNTAESLALKKNFSHIVELFFRCKNEPPDTEEYEEVEDDAQSDFFCDICDRNFSETVYRDHVTSTVHQFNLKRDKQTTVNRFSIPKKNRGLKIMLKQGWDKESGLGPTNSGRLYPVKTVIRKDRTGLGIKQSPARVTHFKAYDLRAIKAKPRPRVKTRNDMK